VYAHERALAEPEDQALGRLHTYYLHAVAEAADLLGPEVPSLVRCRRARARTGSATGIRRWTG